MRAVWRKKPDNVLIYATSNRRHLIREKFSDKEEVREDMHTSDTVQEKAFTLCAVRRDDLLRRAG